MIGIFITSIAFGLVIFMSLYSFLINILLKSILGDHPICGILTQVCIIKSIHSCQEKESIRVTAKMVYRYYPIHQGTGKYI